MHGPDYTREIELQPDTGYLDGIPATFSTWTNHPDDLPSLTLESVKLGGHTMSRTALVEWLGKAEVERMEAAYVPEGWNSGEQAACDRADAWWRECAA